MGTGETEPGGVLALDIATNCGWAYAGPRAVMPRTVIEASSVQPAGIVSGAFRVARPGADIGPFLAAYQDRLADLITEHAPRFLVFEAPILPSTTQMATLRKLYGLAALTEMVCHLRQVRVYEAQPSKVRKHFTGSGKGGPDKKERVIAAARALGFEPETHDEADALAVLQYALSILERSLAA